MIRCPECKDGIVENYRICPGCGADLAQEAERSGQELVGVEIDERYRLEELIGEGAMGWVYRAHHLMLGSTVAVKLLKSLDGEQIQVTRFGQEARFASRLSHPHVLSVHDFGQTPGGLLYMVSDYLDGQGLDELLSDRRPLPIDRVATMFTQVLAAMEEAHSFGLIHRDLKPENIMTVPLRSGEDFVKVLDFGIAKLATPGGTRLTKKGEILGTPAYMAPELIRGEDASPTCDVYSLGLILFEMLTGRHPFDTTSLVQMLSMQLQRPVPPLAEVCPERLFPAAMETLIQGCVAKIPEERYPSVAQLRAAFIHAIHEVDDIQVPCDQCHQRPRSAWSSSSSGCSSAETVEFSLEMETLPEQARQPTARVQDPRPLKPTAQTQPGDIHPRRREERDRIEQFLAGSDAALELLAPRGGGKSRLLADTAHWIREGGGQVVLTGADSRLTRSPWYPWRRIVAELLELEAPDPKLETLHRESRKRGFDDSQSSGLQRLFWPGERAAQNGQREERLDRLRRGVVAALRWAVQKHGTLTVLLDDLDEYDGGSRALTQRLADAAIPGLRLVCTAEAPVLQESTKISRLRLKPLSSDQISQWIQRLGSVEVSRNQAKSLLAVGGGNPLHTKMLLQLIGQHTGPVSGTLEELVRMSYVALPSGAARTLLLLALAGTELDLRLMATALPEKDALQEHVDHLVSAALVRRLAPDRIEVTHPLIGQVVRDMTPEASQRNLHQRLLQCHTDHGGTVFSRARHAFEAHLGQQALDLMEAAGDEAAAWLDDEGAAVRYRQALHIARWELHLEPGQARLLRLSLKLGEALRASGHLLGAEVIYKEAIPHADGHATLRRGLERGLDELLQQRGLTADDR